MLFNSIEFAFFLPVVFLLYWIVMGGDGRAQNLFLVAASYFFYGWWDWRFLSLLFFSSCVDYFIGIGLRGSKYKRIRLPLLLLSIFVNLGVLGFFKYFNFFTESFAQAFTMMGRSFEPNRLDIILPVGISFYTFQTLSYTIDIYRKKLSPTSDVISFFAYVSFFPQLVAGPIERATNLLPQFYKKRSFEYKKGVDGMKQILWGLFKKMVIADNCAQLVNQVFENYADLNGSTLILGAVLFAFQIYGDFSGYSDIAIGTARLFGFDLMQNFAFPYFSRDMGEFWRRWHISLSTWFRDYIYIPLGGSRGSIWRKIRNTFVIFLLSGFWHGANWTFLAWGFLNACYMLPLLLQKTNQKNLNTIARGKVFPSIKELLQMGLTFGLTVFGWIFFRAESLSQAFEYLSIIFSNSLFEVPYFIEKETGIQILPKKIFLGLLMFSLMEWFGRENKYAIEKLGARWRSEFRYLLYYAIMLSIMLFGGEEEQFIYFQF